MNANNPRSKMNLNRDWRFSHGRQVNAWLPRFDDSNWQTVTIPHDWSVTQPFSQEHSSGTGYLPGGTAFYRKAFSLPKDANGKRALLTFDGVYKNSQVWINGYSLGKRPSGYATFSYDVTPFLRFDQENLLAVRVTHEDVADSRWFTGSGIYRKVTLTLTDPVAIAPDSVFIRTESADKEKASVLMDAAIENTTTEAIDASLTHEIVDQQGDVVATSQETLAIAAENTSEKTACLEVSQPKLWSVDSPTLYRCRTSVKVGDALVDQMETTFGIRTFAFDANQGFSLNGESMKLKGVCVHHDAGCLGAAVRKKVWRRRLDKLKHLGCNGIRMSHNPHMPELYDLCDQMGFLVIDEAFDEWEGVKNKWVNGHNVYPPSHDGYAEDFQEWHEEDLKSLILRDRNHPSIILWSIGNEIDYPNDPYGHPAFEQYAGNNDKNKPKRELIYDDTKPHADRVAVIARRLRDVVKKYDTTRPVTAALAAPELSNLTGFADCLEVAGYNYMERCYEKDHATYPQRVIMGSENGKFIEQWQAVTDHEYISGLFLWTGYDFLGETRGWPSHGSEAGLLDVAGHAKPAYYFWQSLWQEKPVATLFASLPQTQEMRWQRGAYSKNLSRNWNFAPSEKVSVHCFTNAAKAELFLANVSQGVIEAPNEEGFRVWQVEYQPQELRVEATMADGTVIQDTLRPAGCPVALAATCYDSDLLADGQDIMQIELTVVDDQGHVVDRADNLIDVSVRGAATLLGLENGDLTDNTPYAHSFRRAHRGRLLIYVISNGQAGSVTVEAKTSILRPIILQFETS